MSKSKSLPALDNASLLALILTKDPYSSWTRTGAGRLGFGEYRDTVSDGNPSLKLDALGLWDFKEGRAEKSLWQIGRELEIDGCEKRPAVERQKKEAIDEERAKAQARIVKRLEDRAKWIADAEIMLAYFGKERGIPFPDRKTALKFLHRELHATVQRFKHKVSGENVIEIVIPMLGAGGELVQCMKIGVTESGKKIEGGKKLKFEAGNRDRAIMFGPENAREAIVLEGIEDAMSIRFGIVGAERVRFFVTGGAGSFGKAKGLVESGGHESRIAILDRDSGEASLLGSYSLGERFLRYLPANEKQDANAALLSGGTETLREWFTGLGRLEWEAVEAKLNDDNSAEDIAAELDAHEFHRLRNPCSDDAAVRFLVRRYGKRLRTLENGQVAAWRGQVWSERSAEGRIRKWISSLISIYIKEAKKAGGTETEEGKRLFNFADSLGSHGRKVSIMNCLKDDIETIECMVDDFDKQPNYLNCQNGVLDLETGKLLPHAPELMCSRICNVNWNPDAKAPRFEQFLSEISNGDDELMLYKLRQLGYIISGYTHEKAIFFHLGAGDNGKSVEADVISWLMGSYARTVSTELFLEQRFANETLYEMATLPGVRLIIASETDENRTWSESLIKKMTGGNDRITARHIRRGPFSFLPRFKPLIHGNNKPKTKSADPAFWRRLHLVPYDYTPSADEIDPFLTQKLKNEGEGILRLLYGGFREWRARGLQPPQRVSAAKEEYQSEVFDDVTEYLEKRCEVGENFRVSSTVLYRDYELFCKERKKGAKTLTAFGRELSRKGFEVIKSDTKFRCGLRLFDQVGDFENVKNAAESDPFDDED